jgi:hypothetical protein
MSCGLVRSGDFRSGTPITIPHQFGTPINNPEPFGNILPQSNATMNSNPVTWTPSPTHFGDMIGFSLQSVPPIVIVARGLTGTVNIVKTDLRGSNSPTLSYTGAPAGVTVAFAPNPDTGTSVATITVGAAVPVGKYTITIPGTTSTETENTFIHLVVI